MNFYEIIWRKLKERIQKDSEAWTYGGFDNGKAAEAISLLEFMNEQEDFAKGYTHDL